MALDGSVRIPNRRQRRRCKIRGASHTGDWLFLRTKHSWSISHNLNNARLRRPVVRRPQAPAHWQRTSGSEVSCTP